MLVLPWRSDAPVYHRPWGTIALIAANIAAFAATWSDRRPEADPLAAPGARPALEYAAWFADRWVLPYGEGFTPLRWLTSAFAHSGLVHLIGNLLFLWTFGLIVEGKLGWKRFVPLYLGMAAAIAAGEQALMLGAHGGGSLGASAAVTAVMTIAWLWAPRNEMDVVWWFFMRPRNLEVPVAVVCAGFIGFDLWCAWLLGFAMTTPALHLLGVAVGAAAGVAALRFGWVDCEGWDLLTLWRHGRPQPRRAGIVAAPPADPAARRAQALGLARDYIADGEPALALRVLDAAATVGGWPLPAAESLALVRGLEGADLHEDAARVAAAARDVADDDALRLAHARLLIERLGRPTKGLAALAAIDASALDAAAREDCTRLRTRAEEQRAAGTFELLD